MPLKRNDTPVLVALPDSLPKIFEQAQVSTANHQKNFVALNKLHSAAVSITAPLQNGIDLQLTGEKAFEDLFIDMIVRILPVKKGATVVDRIVKFVAGYVRFIHEKEKESIKHGEEDDETPTSRFVSRLIRYLLKGFEAKDKNVRFRVLQFVAEVSENMGEIDKDMYKLLYPTLVDRARDKEPPVRTQAIVALTNVLSHHEGPENDREELIEVILESMTYDPTSEVRKAALQRVPVTPATLPAIIKRTRDVDANVRKMVYIPVLEQLENPRQLSIAQRELLALAGLKDRDPAVRATAAKLFASWADLLPDVLHFIELFDFELSEDSTENNPAQEALMALFETRKDILDGLEFGDAYWQELTPAKAFLARVFVDHCVKKEDDGRIEANMPVMTALAFKIQELYNELMNRTEADKENRAFGTEDASDDESKAAESASKEFIIGDLMKLSLNLDYADEIGRRKMFALVRHMVSQDSLPDRLVPLGLDILRKLSSDEHDLIRIVVEVIHDLRDTETDDDDLRQSVDRSMSVDDSPIPARTPGRPRKPPSDMTPEERERADAVDLRCLSLCIGMLERVNSSFERNSTLEGVLGELILPAVKRKELTLREKGFVCLGLCCLIARGMALNSFPLFLQQINPSPESLKLRILQIVFDILMVYEGDFLRNASIGGDRVVEFLTRLFESTESYTVQALLCKGLAKLMMSGMVNDERVLQTLIVAYMSPDTADNQEVRQCLSYFLPAYCYSSSQNQRRMQKIFLSTYEELSRIHRELDEDEEMVSPLQAGMLLIDWTDPQKSMEVHGRQTDQYVHFDLAIDIMRALLGKEFDRDERKALCQLTGKLYLPDEVDDDKIRTLKLLVSNIRSRRPPKDSTSSNALSRFEKAISSKYEKQLASFNEEEYRQLEELKELFEFLDDIIPEDDEEEEKPKRGSRKRRSESIISTTTIGASEDDYRGTPEPKPSSKGRSKAKKRRVSNSDAESNDEATPVAPTRSLPKRAARRAPVIDAVPDSEEGEEFDLESVGGPTDTETEEGTPAPSPTPKIKRGGSFLRRRTGLQANSEDLPDEPTFDSIIDTTLEAGDAEEDDDEVDNLLDDL
ncbi:YCG1_1 [Sanghuangporus sanghuang]